MKKLLAGLACVALAGCTSIDEKMAPWMGVHVDNLISAWGPPQSAFPLSNGGQVLQYTNASQMTLPGAVTTTPVTTQHRGTTSAVGPAGYASGTYSGTSTTYAQTRAPDMHLSFHCTVRVTVDPSGVISSWNAEGNDC